MIIYTPYTYLIGWSKLNTFYYGVRYAVKSACLYETGCHPDELWKTYFTSSDYVLDFTKLHGEPDIIQVRKVFDCQIKAREWETKVLKRLNVKTNEKWLNKSDNISMAPECRITNHSEETKAILSAKGKLRIGELNSFYGKKHSEETKNIISDKKKGIPSGMTPMLGKVHSEETKQKISAGGKGKKKPESMKKTLSDLKKGVARLKVVCPHCALVGAIGIMSRWHFDNCKTNPLRLANGAI